MRLLPAIRLSVMDDNSTSPERQLAKITQYAEFGDHVLVPTHDQDWDLDVSGAVSPFDRPGLGRWLTEDRLHEWDALCVARFDRISRSMFDFTTLMHWLEAHGKTLICLDPMLNLSTSDGRAMANMLMAFAEYEREIIGQRVKDAYDKLIASGKYAGGQVPFGYRPVKLSKGFGYEKDPDYGPKVAEMAERYAAYESISSIARWLNDTGVPTPWNATRRRNGKDEKQSLWSSTSVQKILKSHAILGAVVDTAGQPVRDAQGMIIYRAPGLVSRDLFERVQARLRANPVSAKVNSWLLTGIAFCGQCGGAMYSTVTKTGGKEYVYYVCNVANKHDGRCAARRVKAGPLEAVIHEKLLEVAGHVELTENRLIPGRDYSEEVAKVVDQVTHLNREIALGRVGKRDVSHERGMLVRAEAELDRLSSLEPEPSRLEPVRLGKTFAQHWGSLDTVGRNEFLRSSEVRAIVEPWAEGMPHLLAVPKAASDRTMIMFGHGMRIVLDLGNLAKLRDHARQRCDRMS